MHPTISSRAISLLLLAGWMGNAGGQAQIVDVYPDQARFDPGSAATISVELHDPGGSGLSGELQVSISRLADPVAEFTRPVVLSPGEERIETFTWPTWADDYSGYGVDADFLVDGSVVSSHSSALDVSHDFVRFPRYGYYTDFHPAQTLERLDWEVDNLRKHHINVVQYYDWMWTHDHLIPFDESGSPIEEYDDIFGLRKQLSNIRRKIDRGHDRGMEAMAYSLIYGDSGDESGPEQITWASFTDPYKTASTDVRNHIGKIWVMDVSNEDWQAHIFGEFRNAMSELNFDGIHLDNLGGAWSYRYDSDDGIPEDIAFPSFINDCKAELLTHTSQARLSHNDVYAGYLPSVAPTDTDFYYAEVWGLDRYIDIRNLICSAKAAGGRDKAVVLAAYMNRDDPPPDYINEASVRLMNACVAANGAFHIELGNGDHMLTNEFFPVHLPMHDTLKRAMRDHYNFIVRYENLLYFNTLGGVRDGTDDLRISSPSHLLSKDASADTIWTVARIWDGEYDAVSLINLNGVDDQWRNVCANPQVQAGIALKYYLDKKCRRVLVATPDDGLGRPVDLPFTEGIDGDGYFVELTVPSLQWWDLLIFDKTTRIKADGWPGDWGGEAPGQVHGMVVSNGEFIYRGEADDHRTFGGASTDSDLTEVRVTADGDYLHFLIRMQEIADAQIPAIGIAIDTDQDPGDSGHAWIGDASTPTASIGLSDPRQWAEREVMIYSEGGLPRIKLWDGGSWYDPPSGVATVAVSPVDGCIEASLTKWDLGISAPQQVKMSLASFRSSGNPAGSDSTYDSPDENNDAIDVMGGAPGISDNAWGRDLSDNAIGHHATFLVDENEVRPLLQFVGHARYVPDPPRALETLTLEAETFPRGSAGSVTVIWRLNGSSWNELPLDYVGEVTVNGINDLWRRGLGSFQPGDFIEYGFRAAMADGTSLLDDNDGVNYNVTIPLDGDGDGLDDTWELTHGLAITSDSGTDGAYGDADGDKIVNLLERILGGDPNLADPGILPQANIADGKLWISFTRDTSADLAVAVEAAIDPAGPWIVVAGAEASEAMAGFGEDVAVNESGAGTLRSVAIGVNRTGFGQRFLRVRVTGR